MSLLRTILNEITFTNTTALWLPLLLKTPYSLILSRVLINTKPIKSSLPLPLDLAPGLTIQIFFNPSMSSWGRYSLSCGKTNYMGSYWSRYNAHALVVNVFVYIFNLSCKAKTFFIENKLVISLCKTKDATRNTQYTSISIPTINKVQYLNTKTYAFLLAKEKHIFI